MMLGNRVPADNGKAANGRITTERRGPLLLIGIDSQEKLNSFTPSMHVALQVAYVELDEDPDLWVSVLYGHGPHFTSELDLPKYAQLMQDGKQPLDMSKVDPRARWQRCRKPVITAVSGITYTAGLELTLAGDIAVAASDCRFSQLEPKRGILATRGAVMRFVERCGWGNAMVHLLTGDEFGTDEALRTSLVQQAVRPGEELDRAIKIAEETAANAPLAVRATIENALTYAHNGEHAAVEALCPTKTRLAATIDAAKGIRSFAERRRATFVGA